MMPIIGIIIFDEQWFFSMNVRFYTVSESKSSCQPAYENKQTKKDDFIPFPSFPS